MGNLIQDFLNRPENRDRARQHAELEQEIETQRGRMQEAEKQRVIREEKRRYLSGLLQQQNETLQEAVWEEDALQQYFLEELRLGLYSVSGETLEQQAEEASRKVRPEDRERTPERIGETLRNNYQQHNNMKIPPLLPRQRRLRTADMTAIRNCCCLNCWQIWWRKHNHHKPFIGTGPTKKFVGSAS